MNKNTAASSS